MRAVSTGDSPETSANMLGFFRVVAANRPIAEVKAAGFSGGFFEDFFEDCHEDSPGDSASAGEEASNVSPHVPCHCRNCTKNLLTTVACLVMVEFQ